MRKSIFLFCFLALGLSGCAYKEDPTLRAREQRSYPDPTLGTENSESQWYRTQTIAAPSALSASTADSQGPAANAPARAPKTPVPTRKLIPRPNPTGTPTAN